MRSKGCADARTIHSLIYRATDSETEEPSFVLNDDSDAAHAKLIVIDECSMVDEELGRDLLSFGKKVLVLGDPAQLPAALAQECAMSFVPGPALSRNTRVSLACGSSMGRTKVDGAIHFQPPKR